MDSCRLHPEGGCLSSKFYWKHTLAFHCNPTACSTAPSPSSPPSPPLLSHPTPLHSTLLWHTITTLLAISKTSRTFGEGGGPRDWRKWIQSSAPTPLGHPRGLGAPSAPPSLPPSGESPKPSQPCDHAPLELEPAPSLNHFGRTIVLCLSRHIDIRVLAWLVILSPLVPRVD